LLPARERASEVDIELTLRPDPARGRAAGQAVVVLDGTLTASR
jgi:hypothetical protein